MATTAHTERNDGASGAALLAGLLAVVALLLALVALETLAGRAFDAPRLIADEAPAVDAGLLAKVNRDVNRQYAPLSPIADPRDGVWDCENYAWEKRSRLIAAGVPAKALRVWGATTDQGEPHAVLVVATRRGKYVLDNLHPRPVPLDRIGYTDWRPLWVTLNPPAAP